MCGFLAWSHVTEAEKLEILRGIEDGRAYTGPLHVELQLTDRCNIDCFFCGTRRHRTQESLPLDDVRRLIGEMKELGTHATTLNGGGEPLLHPDVKTVLELLADAEISLFDLTTNGTLLDRDVAALLVDMRCEQVIVSLNAPDPAMYSQMMGTPEETFHRVVGNLKNLLAIRGSRSRPNIFVQFLFHQGNYRSVPDMYRLARDIGVDKILFNGLAYQPAERRMNRDETAELLELFGAILSEDDGLVGAVHGYEEDLDAEIAAMRRRSFPGQLCKWLVKAHSILANDRPWRWKARCLWLHRRGRQGIAALRERSDTCIAPWYMVTVRADKSVPLCHVIQTPALASLAEITLSEVWYGEPFQRIRRKMRSLYGGEELAKRADSRLPRICAPDARGAGRCHFRQYFYSEDLPFLANLMKTPLAGRRSSPFPP